MNRFRQGFKILFLFALLFAVILVPGHIMEASSRSLLNEISLYPVGMVEVDDAQELDIWERVKLLNGDVTQVQSSLYVNLQVDDKLIQKLEEQIRLLQEYKVLPELQFPEHESAFYSERIYMDPENLERSVQVWQIGVVYGTLYVEAHMDAETSALYSISIYDEHGTPFVSDYSGISAQGFLTYLASFSKGESLPDEEITVLYHYRNERIDLSLISDALADADAIYRISLAPES